MDNLLVHARRNLHRRVAEYVSRARQRRSLPAASHFLKRPDPARGMLRSPAADSRPVRLCRANPVRATGCAAAALSSTSRYQGVLIASVCPNSFDLRNKLRRSQAGMRHACAPPPRRFEARAGAFSRIRSEDLHLRQLGQPRLRRRLAPHSAQSPARRLSVTTGAKWTV